jgi:predicted Fe-Mo cluster-binding NifX family protein
MRICIPSETKGGLDDQVGYHFGRVDYYTIYDDTNERVQIIPNTSSHKGGTKYPAEILREQNVDVMVCGGLGRRAIQLFEEYGIEVYCGAHGTVSEAIKQFKQNNLEMATDKNACAEHAYRNKDHNHHHE